MGNKVSSMDNNCKIDNFKKTRNINWDEFKRMIEDINDKCQFIVDSNDNYLLFYIQKGSRGCIFWKLTSKILLLKINVKTSRPVSHRILSVREFVRIYNSIMFTVDTSINSMQNKSFTSSYLKNSLFGPSCGSETTNEDGECLICLDRNPNTVLPCSHAFCEICIDRIKECNKNFCPLCREEIKKDGNEDLWSIPDLPEYSEIQNYMLSIVNDTNKDD